MGHGIKNRFTSLFLSSRLSWEKIATVLVTNNNLLMAGMILVTLMLIVPGSQVRIDPSGVSFGTGDSDHYREYQEFVASFGTDDYILLAVKNDLHVSDPRFKDRILQVNRGLAAISAVLQVIDLGTLESSDLVKLTGRSGFWDKTVLDSLFPIIPGLSRLISKDAKILAFIVKIDNETLNGFQLEARLEQMKQIIVSHFPEQPRCYAAGIPVLRAAFERYNLLNAIVFGSLGLVFGILLGLYIFKTLWAGILVLFTSLGSLIWTLGIMGIFGLPLNLATGLSFGFILVVSTTTVFHITSKYLQLLKNHSKQTALITTFEIVLRPCFMCALTTAAGFFCLTISPVKMVHQAGIIISIGVILAFLLTLVITCFCLPRFLLFKESTDHKIQHDLLEKMVENHLTAGFKSPVLSVMAGIMIFVLLAAGIPDIKMVRHLTRPIIKTTIEAQDMDFIEQNISSATSFSIVLTSLENGFDSKKFWYDLYQFEETLKSIDGVQAVESLTPVVFSLALKLSPMGIRPEMMFHQIMSKSLESDLIRSYVDPVLKKFRIIVHIENKRSDQTEAILQQVENEAHLSFKPYARVNLSGQLILLRSQTMDLVSSQLKTLFLAFFTITVLMMLQLKSVVIGLLSLIPNMFPLVAIFGIMGWFKIPLDPLTIFAAVISFGLSVDDSIHFLTQLKRQMMVSTDNTDIQESLKSAYEITARALVSTTAVLFLSSSGLVFSSFSHVVSLGVLIASASIVALIADIIFMPALVLTVAPINRLLSHKMKNLVALTHKK